MVVTRALRTHLPVLAMAALVVTACGSQQSSANTAGGDASASPSSSPTHTGPTAPPGTPDCSSVWTAGATLPRSYKGCVQGASYVKRDAIGCESGQAIIRYADRFYAVPGGTIHQTAKSLKGDRKYLAAVYRCRA